MKKITIFAINDDNTISVIDIASFHLKAVDINVNAIDVRILEYNLVFFVFIFFPFINCV